MARFIGLRRVNFDGYGDHKTGPLQINADHITTIDTDTRYGTTVSIVRVVEVKEPYFVAETPSQILALIDAAQSKAEG
jgi:hypothetical protein